MELKGVELSGTAEHFEPLLDGDIPTEKRVARAHNPLQSRFLAVSLS
jgi:hypothetical protein